MKNAYEVLVRKHESNKPLGRYGCRCWDNIGMDFSKTEWEVVDWIRPALDKDQWRALMNTVMNVGVP
jgi:hypothetical protein